MDQKIKEDILTHLKTQIMNRYHLNSDEIKELGGYQNLVFLVRIDDKDYILRVTHSSHRTKDELLEEINFVNYLYNHHVKVSHAIKLEWNELVEEMCTSEHKYYITLFEKAVGFNWYEYETNNDTYYLAGIELGKIHHLSKLLTKKVHRKEIFENDYLAVAKKVIDNEELLTKLEELLNKIKQLPKDNDSFGLTHGDYNFANMIYKDQENIMIFDFDECEYNWYIYDIVVYLFYYLLGGNPAQMDIEPNVELFKAFMRGYLKETSINIFWIENIQHFFRLREFILLASIYRSNDLNQLSKWNQSFVKATIERIKSNENFIEIDYVQLFEDITTK